MPARPARSIRPSQALWTSGPTPWLSEAALSFPTAVFNPPTGRSPQDSGNLSVARLRRSGRIDELRREPARRVPAGRHLCRSHSQGRKTCGAAGDAVNHVRARDQRPDRWTLGITVPPTLLALADEVIE